jgi:two-component system, OmpR family, sensor histidine kinase QseC
MMPGLWRGPTLARRVTLALLLAFALVWIVLLARQFHVATDRDAIDANLQALGANLLASIAPIDNAGEARAVVASTATLINNAYRKEGVPGALLMELRAADGRRLFFSPEGGQGALHGAPERITGAAVNGQRFRVYLGKSARWTLLVAAPRLDAAWVLRSMAGGLTTDMLIAFPFVLLPIWFAVGRGLRPLRQLSTSIAGRGADDLAPLGFDAQYAELRPLAAALDNLLARLRERLAREQGFVQDAAHELRTPLAVISAQAHVLEMARDEAQRADAGRRMDGAIARASHLVEQLLTLARMDSRLGPEPDELDVAQLLRHELALLAPAAIARDIDLSLEAPDTLRYRLDVHAFRSIVHNLVGNALAYVAAGGQVQVALRAQGKSLVLAVADDGPGIAPGDRGMAFERFWRGSGHDVPGAGLGLAIVREAAARLGGGVTLADGIGGRGCEFTVMVGTPSGAGASALPNSGVAGRSPLADAP